MFNKTFRPLSLPIFLILIIYSSCKKQDEYLDEKPNQSLAVPTTLNELQLLLHNEAVMNNGCGPSLGTISSDEFYVTTGNWSRTSATERNTYIFKKEIFNGEAVAEWNNAYRQIYYVNTVLDYLPKIKINANELEQSNSIKGKSLFYRAFAFYNLVQTFANQYDSSTAKTDLGIPLRLTSDLNIKLNRATNEECYRQIISDLNLSIALLPTSTSYVTDPSRTTAQALLARIYLSMGKYDDARNSANAVLQVKNSLVDYNTLTYSEYFLTGDGSSSYLAEDIFHSTIYLYDIQSPRLAIVDSSLYMQFDSTDLRQKTFFVDRSGAIRFKGSYELNRYGSLYGGLATDEMYLIRSECNARLNNTTAALEDLNYLLKNRYKTGTFTPITASSSKDALSLILKERRKELCFRGIRWFDLRRLNKEQQYAVTIKRVIDGQLYTLLPNDSKYVMPIPDAEIQLTGISQNPR